ncbi:MAG: aldose 1-epimerase [Pseudomonadota bacterium]
MTNTITLSTADARVELSPSEGAAVVHYTLTDGTALFRPTPSEVQSPFDYACILMVPWCNRISDGGFYLDGDFYPITPNMPGQDCPLHGNAFLQPWRVVEQASDSVEMALVSRGPAPYHYEARVRYTLRGAALSLDLGVCHWGDSRVPYGLGIHPWFDKDDDTTLQFKSAEFVSADAQTLPVARMPLSSEPNWQFDAGKRLPVDGIDNAFCGWDGRARLSWPSQGRYLEVVTDPPQVCCHVFTPGQTADFFCFEPVSHLPNAHNWQGASPNGLTLLSQGDELAFRSVFTPGSIATR